MLYSANGAWKREITFSNLGLTFTTNFIVLERELSKKLDLSNHRNSDIQVFGKKGVLKDFAKFTGKHLCQSLFFNEVAG